MQRKRGNNWIGIVVFLAIVIGPQIAGPLARALQSATGVAVTPDLVIGGLIILAVVSSVVVSLARGAGRINSGSETRLPSTPSTPPKASPSPRPSLPTTVRSPGGQQVRHPGAPKFEPIIDPRILTFGIVGLIFFGGAFFVILALAGGL